MTQARKRKGKNGGNNATSPPSATNNQQQKNQGNAKKRGNKDNNKDKDKGKGKILMKPTKKEWIDQPNFYEILPIWFTYLGLFLLSFLLYVNAVDSQYALTDAEAVVDNPDVILPSRTWMDLLLHDSIGAPMGSSIASNVWTPLTTATFKAHWKYIGPPPDAMHLISALLYGLSVTAFFSLARLYSRATHSIALSGAFLFLTHPIHTEAVDLISARSHLLSAVLVMFALRSYGSAIRDPVLYLHKPPKQRPTAMCMRGYTYFIVLAALSVLARDSSLFVVFPLAIAYDIVIHGPSNAGTLMRALFHSALLFTAVIARSAVFGTQLIAQRSGAILTDPLATAPHTLSKVLTLAHLFANAVVKLFSPMGLSCDYSYPAFAPISSLSDQRNYLTAGVIGGLLLLALHAIFKAKAAYRSRILLGLSLIVGGFFPFSHILLPFEVPLSEASLFIPSAGAVFILAALAHATNEVFDGARGAAATGGELSRILLVGAVLLFAANTFSRNIEWRTETDVIAASLESVPTSAKLHLLQARVGMAANSYDSSVRSLEMAQQLFPDYCDVHIAKGDALISFKDDTHSALSEYRKAVSCAGENDPTPSIVLSHALVASGAFQEAEEVSTRALELWPNNTNVHWSLGHVVVSQARLDEAKEHFQQAILLNPANLDALFSISRIYMDEEHYEPTLAFFFLQQVLLLDPSHSEARTLYRNAQLGAQADYAAKLNQANARGAAQYNQQAAQEEDHGDDEDDEDDEGIVLDEEIFNSKLPPMPNDEEGFHNRVKRLHSKQ